MCRLIKSERDRVPDVPAIYFVRPTAENIDLIAKDCESGRYDVMHINFSSRIDRPLLERLAQRTLDAGSGALSKIAKVTKALQDLSPRPFTFLFTCAGCGSILRVCVIGEQLADAESQTLVHCTLCACL